MLDDLIDAGAVIDTDRAVRGQHELDVQLLNFPLGVEKITAGISRSMRIGADVRGDFRQERIANDPHFVRGKIKTAVARAVARGLNHLDLPGAHGMTSSSSSK